MHIIMYFYSADLHAFSLLHAFSWALERFFICSMLFQLFRKFLMRLCTFFCVCVTTTRFSVYFHVFLTSLYRIGTFSHCFESLYQFFCTCGRFSAFVSLQHIFSAHIHVFVTAPRLFFCIGSFFTHLHFCNVFDSFCNYFYAWAHFIAFVLLQLVQLHVVLPPPSVFCA